MAAAQRQWGWHQLDRQWADRLVAEARLPRGALAIDVGAGTGTITSALLRAGARVIAVEAHPERALHLRQQFGRGIVVVRADAAHLRLPRHAFHVVANPPFAITTAMLRRLLQPGSRLVSAHLVLQAQAARRWARPDAPGARRWTRDFAVTLGPRIPRGAFSPAPHVDARLFVIQRRR